MAVDLIDMRHELVKLAALVDWEFFEREWSGFFPSHDRRRPARRAAAGGGAALSPARLRAVGRGRGRALGREPVLPALHRRDLLPAPSTDRPDLADPLAQADRRRGRGMAADARPSRPAVRRARSRTRAWTGSRSTVTGQGERRGRRFPGERDGEEHRAPDGLPALRAGAGAAGGYRPEAGIDLRQSYARLAPGSRPRSDATPTPGSSSGCARR